MTFLSLRRALLPLALVLLAGCGAQSSQKTSNGPTAVPTPSPANVPTAVVSGGPVAATVNGAAIPMSTYRLTLKFDQQVYAGGPGMTKKVIASQAMDQVIVNELVRQYAAAHHIPISSSDVNKEIQTEEARAGGTAKFQGQLHRVGITLAEYKALVKPELLTHKVADRLFPVPPQTVRTAHVEHILIATRPTGKPARTDAQARSLAEDILHRVRQGANFAQLAHQYSDDPGSAQQGGDLGNISQGQTVPPFDKAAFSAPLHVPMLVHSTYGYHILEVLSRGTSTQPSQTGVQQQRQKFSLWARQQMQKAKIKRIAKVA